MKGQFITTEILLLLIVIALVSGMNERHFKLHLSSNKAFISFDQLEIIIDYITCQFRPAVRNVRFIATVTD